MKGGKIGSPSIILVIFLTLTEGEGRRAGRPASPTAARLPNSTSRRQPGDGGASPSTPYVNGPKGGRVK